MILWSKKIICFIGLFAFFVLGSVFAEGPVKNPNVAGQFYPADKNELSRLIDSYFSRVPENPYLNDKDIVALISPHAGYVYSGQVASYAYTLLKGKHFDTVVILAPSHYFPFASASIYKEGVFRTPLGEISVDSELAQALLKQNPRFQFLPQVFEQEHSLEVELPFLQKVLGNFKLVPILCGQFETNDCASLAQTLAEVLKGKNVLVVISTDMSHYYPYNKAVILDKTTLSLIHNLDLEGLAQASSDKKAELCGIVPVEILLAYAKLSGLKPEVVRYANSGDVTGDKSRVVGYGSVVFYKESTKTDPVPETKQEGAMFNEQQKKRLLEIARESLTAYVTTGKQKEFKEDDPQLNIRRGLFVTLRKHGALRGCLGMFSSNDPLYKAVAGKVLESAAQDPRFPAMTKEEIPEVTIEISVLTESQPIDDWKKIRLGTDGVIIQQGFRSGVFLPQVATETGWDLETFLSELCFQKAGLAPNAYKNPKTKLFIFQAFVFSEPENH